MKEIKTFLIFACLFLAANSANATCAGAFSNGYAVATANHAATVRQCYNAFGNIWNIFSGDAIGAISDLIAFDSCQRNAQGVFDSTVDALLHSYDCCIGGC